MTVSERISSQEGSLLDCQHLSVLNLCRVKKLASEHGLGLDMISFAIEEVSIQFVDKEVII